MSLFVSAEPACPECGVGVPFELVTSVNGGRKPEQRAAILDETFQQGRCESCGYVFRAEPRFAYLDVGRGEWIAVYPSLALADWSALEEEAASLFAESFGRRAPGVARQVGEELRPRLVFGWEALREKLVSDELGVDDRTLELVKLALIRAEPESPFLRAQLRLVSGDDDELVLQWRDRSTGVLLDTLGVPRTLVGEIETEAAWVPLRDQLSEGLFIDVQRLYLA